MEARNIIGGANYTAADAAVIMNRIFRLKFQAYVADIMNYDVFGKAKAMLWTVEFQKRGLPHAHMMVILDEESKPKTVQDYLMIPNYMN